MQYESDLVNGHIPDSKEITIEDCKDAYIKLFSTLESMELKDIYSNDRLRSMDKFLCTILIPVEEHPEMWLSPLEYVRRHFYDPDLTSFYNHIQCMLKALGAEE